MGSKKETIHADPVAGNLKELGKRGIGLQEKGVEALGKIDPTQGVIGDVAREEKLARQGSQDQIMRAKQMAAQQGLQGTSIAAGAEQQATQGMADRLGAIRGSIGSRLREAQKGHAEGLIGAGSGLVSQMGPIRMRDETIKKKGVLGTALGAGAGALMGGPQGAQMGAQIGGAFD